MDITQDSPLPAAPGQVLAESRESQGLSRAEVAQRLHMSASQVEALEAGEYERLPKGTFLRGFVRNYAKLLGVEAEPLLAGLSQAAPVAAPGIVVPSQNIRFEPLHERISSSPYVKGGLIAAIVLGLAFAGMYWWTAIRTAPPGAHPVAAKKAEPVVAPPKQIAVAPLSTPEVPPPMEAPKVEATVAPKVEPPKATPPKAEAPKVEPVKAATPTPTPTLPQGGGSKAARLHFAFTGESWVEVRDAQGKVLMSKLNEPGSETDVSGKLPLTVIVGNAPSVTMLYNDRAFPLEPHTKVAVARFTVE